MKAILMLKDKIYINRGKNSISCDNGDYIFYESFNSLMKKMESLPEKVESDGDDPEPFF
jgi:hypothetical protein